MAEPLLRIESLCKSFGAVKACHDLSLEVHAGEIHALIGPNGAGKTTLLNQIAGDLTPDSGQIFLAGQDITPLPLYRRAPLGLARSYQITSVFANLSVEENMLLAIQAHHGHSFRFWGRGLKDPQLLAELGPALETVGLSERGRDGTGREHRTLQVDPQAKERDDNPVGRARHGGDFLPRRSHHSAGIRRGGCYR